MQYGGAALTATVTIHPIVTGVTYTSCTGTQTLTGLVQGTPYSVRVLAYNKLGYGLAQLASSPQKPMVVPGLADSVSISPASGTSLRVVFTPPADNGGDTIDQYLVEWDLLANFSGNAMGDGAFGSAPVNYLAGGAPFTYTITGLTMGQSYFVRVKAHNSQGYGTGKTSTPASEYPRQLPTAPQNVVLSVTSDSKLTVSYATPANQGGDTV